MRKFKDCGQTGRVLGVDVKQRPEPQGQAKKGVELKSGVCSALQAEQLGSEQHLQGRWHLFSQLNTVYGLAMALGLGQV